LSAPSSTSFGLTDLDWFLIVLAIIFCILLIGGVVWASRRRKT
jgi:hypothetical protein